jgi:hypothetical protein
MTQESLFAGTLAPLDYTCRADQMSGAADVRYIDSSGMDNQLTNATPGGSGRVIIRFLIFGSFVDIHATPKPSSDMYRLA